MKKPKGNFNQILAPLLFLTPNMLIFLVFIIVPAVQGLRMSFMDWGVFKTPRFIGLDNFRELLSDYVFRITVRNTLVYSALTVVLLLTAAMILAMMLHKNSVPGERVFRAIFYIPALLSMITVGISWRFILGDEMGIINYFIRLGGGTGVRWLTDSVLAMFSVIVVSVWASAGYYMVILIAGLQAVPRELYEAAHIDGASPVKVFLRITLPLLRSTILVVMVLSTISTFKAYELISVMTKGGPGYATKFIVQQVYQAAFVEDRLGYATSMSMVLMLMTGLFTLIQFKTSGREQDYE
ncbi:MAG: sugar ABC transporter permease [Treponema sp.]|jgi:alpha-1,4-digalacturonate transport system permease protein|nr:sugar ABC transporter permease [Treponema sp.]